MCSERVGLEMKICVIDLGNWGFVLKKIWIRRKLLKWNSERRHSENLHGKAVTWGYSETSIASTIEALDRRWGTR
jgi:hypothetical protein